MSGKDVGITVKKGENFSEWYTQVVTKAELADYAGIKGFMVLMPYGYSIWENIVNYIDRRIKEMGHRNAYFPTLIPESFLKREAEHFQGFVPEVFWATHAGDEEMGERLAIRPTSETIIYDSYSRWVRSWRDLPVLINCWNSVLRAEITMTKPFLRTSEFLWQEGHTVHETQEEAEKEVMDMLGVYKELMERLLAIPVLGGKKSDSDKFVGALYTTTLEAIMPDGKALQMGTSHNLGQNFAKSFGIKFLGRDEKEHYAWQTSWGVSWRMIGAMIMVHGDDKGLVLPPKIAPIQVVVVPIYKSEGKAAVLGKARSICQELIKGGIAAHVDDREQYTPGWKFNEWELKGVPLRLEVGPRDIENKQAILARRDNFQKITVKENELTDRTLATLAEIQNSLFERAKNILQTYTNAVTSYSQFKEILEERGGFLRACWCGRTHCESSIKEETGATIRIIPFNGGGIFSACVYCGEQAKTVAYFAKAY